jgi:type II secretory pathway component PulF
MPAFSYTAIDLAGKKVSGSVSVRNKTEAYRELESKSLTPVLVQEGDEGGAKKSGARAGKESIKRGIKLKRPELVLFTEELGKNSIP